MSAPLRVLFVEDDVNDFDLTLRTIRAAGLEVTALRVDRIEMLTASLAESEWDLVLCDFGLGSFKAPQALELVRAADPDVPFIALSGTVGEEVAAELMRLGAQDFIVKTNTDRLVPAILRELEETKTKRAHRAGEMRVREAQQRFDQVTSSIREAFWLATPDLRRIEYASPAFERIIGRSVERANESGFAGLEGVHPDDRERVASVFAAAATEAFEVDYRVLLPDGGTRWVAARGDPVKDATGTVVQIAGVTSDIEERHRAETDLQGSMDALRQSERERRNLLREVVRATEEERARLAGDVHDDSVQAMTAVGMRLETLKRRLLDAGVESLAEFEQVQATVSDAVARLRSLMFDLRPPELDDSGVAAAVREYLDRVELPTAFEAADFEEPPPELRTIMYRIAQEAVTNIRKHAVAHSMSVTLSSDPSGWLLRITDDGKGFDPSDRVDDPLHMGLASMRERAEMGGGTLRLESAPGAGTTIEVSLPRRAA